MQKKLKKEFAIYPLLFIIPLYPILLEKEKYDLYYNKNNS